MLEGEHFSYDGIKSTDMGLINIKLNGGMFKEAFLPSRTIRERRVAGREKPYLNSVERDPLEFELTFGFEHGYDEEHIRKVARWLDQDFYKPFYTISNENRVFYCMPSGDSTLTHTGSGEGYFTIVMRCDSPYSYSRQRILENMPFSKNKHILSYHKTADQLIKMGSSKNLEEKDGQIRLAMANVTWSDLLGKKWSDFDD